jgi:hypothetical protein
MNSVFMKTMMGTQNTHVDTEYLLSVQIILNIECECKLEYKMQNTRQTDLLV